MSENKNNTLLIILAVGLILVTFVLALNQNNDVVTTTQQSESTISVAGNSEISVEPDKAELYIKIETEGKTAKDAQDENTEIIEKVMDSFKTNEIKDDDIETDRYYLDQQWDYNPETRKSEQTGYVLRHTLKVTTTDLTEVGNILDDAVSAGANSIERISFGLTDETQKDVNQQALSKASTQAKEKAEAITDDLAVSLGDIRTISESNVNVVPYEYSGRTFAKADMAVEESETVISPSNVQVRAYIGIVYEIN